MKKKKLFRYGILALVAIIIAALMLAGYYTDRLIDPYVRSLLEETRPMGHKIEYKKIRVNLLRSVIVVRDVKMSPDTSLEEGRVKYEIEVDNIVLTGFKIGKMLLNKYLSIQDFRIDNPIVRVTLPEKTEKAVEEIKTRQEPKPKDQMLKSVGLKRIIISEGNFKLYRNDTLLASSNEINFLARSIKLLQNELDEPIGYTFGDVNLSLNHIDFYSETGLYDMKLRHFEASKMDSSIFMEGFKVVPKFDKAEFSNHLQHQDDRFDVSIGRIEIARIGLMSWLAGEPLRISLVKIDSLYADIYRDKNVPFDTTRFPLFYNESFMKINIPLYLDSVLITNSNVLYGELAVDHPVAGSILLQDFNLQSFDLTNQVAGDPEENFMRLQLQAKVMGEGSLNIDLELPLEGDLRRFECSGSVGAMALSPLNDMLEPSMNMKFNGGRLDRMTFAFKANDNTSYGWMEFLYSDLNVSLVKKNPDKQWGFVSLLANAVAVSNNPHKGKEIKTVEIGYERDKNKGIINYVWKTIQSGMVRTIIPTNKHNIELKQEAKGKHKEEKEEKDAEKDIGQGMNDNKDSVKEEGKDNDEGSVKEEDKDKDRGKKKKKRK